MALLRGRVGAGPEAAESTHLVTRRPPPATPVTAKGSGRVSVAGLVCTRPGAPTRLIHRLLPRTGRRGEKKGFGERDFAGLLDQAHQELGRRPVLVWDNSTQHKDAAMRALLADRARWLTVFRLPPYAPKSNPAEGVRANLKASLGNLAPCSVGRLGKLVRTRLKKMQYRHDLLDGFVAETGLVLVPP